MHCSDQIFNVKKILSNLPFSLQTRILVTHGVGFLPQVDKIVVMVNGQVTETGSFEELLSHNGAFADFLRNYSDLADDGDGGCLSVCFYDQHFF